MTSNSTAEDIGALWLSTLQRAVARASHDVKDALNGVSVNLEVIRSRAAKPDVPASAVAKFGDAAGQQLERLATLIDAVLWLARADRAQADVAVTLRRVVCVCGASASARDAAIRIEEGELMGSTITAVSGDVARLAITGILLELAVGTDPAVRASEIVCSLARGADVIEVTIAAKGRRPGMPDNVAEVVRAAGMQWSERDESMSLIFPRA
ncbi:MAG: hypothetical protein JWM95_4134 [Gemmatimonadetes bacterium]|nr:hypothetical protein [Gemmatimonadota bacterium]